MHTDHTIAVSVVLIISRHVFKRIIPAFLLNLFILLPGPASVNIIENHYFNPPISDRVLSQNPIPSFYKVQTGSISAYYYVTFGYRDPVANAGDPDGNLATGPLRNTNWTWLIYLWVLLTLIYGIRKYELSRLSHRTQMKIVNMENQKLKELDQVKTHLFTSISQEFRTPLTMIKGPLEQLIEESDDMQRYNTLKKMHGNASRLLQLVNQLLDLSAIESGEYILEAKTGNVVDLVKGIALSYASVADKKKIKLSLEEGPDMNDPEFRNMFYYDPSVFEKIISNLLSNAFKFTPENGSVTIKICKNTGTEHDGFLEIVIADTGIGIPPDKLPYIYDRFYKVDEASERNHEGSGVGLTYVKELVRVHKGWIRVKSLPDTGTVFNLRFPVGLNHLPPDRIISEEQQRSEYKAIMAEPDQDYDPLSYQSTDITKSQGKPWIMVIDFSAEVRHFIYDILQNDYRVIQSSNASEGLKKAKEFIPGLIISEVIMPDMNGYKLCENLKTSEKTSHIPVILLTARADIKDKIIGLDTGADDYIVKPFNARELKARVDNLINGRRILREKFSEKSIINPGEISVNSRDTFYINKLLEVVEKNIGNHEFSVEDLGKEAGMSKSQLHRKLKALINMPASHFIRSVRMHRAMKMLQNDAGTVAEIAYMVGYDDPGYFTKSFRNFFGKLPSKVLRK
jgi:signal transduction histidine kinase/DNA-binding response OmpR family regulator